MAIKKEESKLPIIISIAFIKVDLNGSPGYTRVQIKSQGDKVLETLIVDSIQGKSQAMENFKVAIMNSQIPAVDDQTVAVTHIEGKLQWKA